jgi:hypothetical protein
MILHHGCLIFLPFFRGQLRNLTHLELSGRLEKTIPTEMYVTTDDALCIWRLFLLVTDIPLGCRGKLAMLQYLRLSATSMNGNIPTEL